MIQENEVRKLKLAEAEERKLATEADERKLAAEAAEQEAERKHILEMEKLRLECERLNEQRSTSWEDQLAALSQASQNALQELKPQCFLVLWTKRIIQRWAQFC